MSRHVTSSRMWFRSHGICNWFSTTFTALTNKHSCSRLHPRYRVETPVHPRHLSVLLTYVCTCLAGESALSINLWPQRTVSMSSTQQWSDICATLFNFLVDDMIGTADAYLKEVGLTWFAVRTREYYHLYTVHFKKTATVCRINRRLEVLLVMMTNDMCY
jgi:hypothetical protein